MIPQMAHALARVHKAARRFSLRRMNAPPHALEHPWLLQSLRRLQLEVADHPGEHHRFFGAHVQECLGILEQFRCTRYSTLPRLPIHGDLCRENLIFSKERLRGVIDFGHCCSDTAIRDVTIALRYECTNGADRFRLDLNAARRFLEAYHANKSIDARGNRADSGDCGGGTGRSISVEDGGNRHQTNHRRAHFRFGMRIQGRAMVQPTSKGHRAGITDVKAMSPYSLPCDHPAARFLETLLPCSRVIDSEAAFLAAGVEIRKEQDRSLLRIATHPMPARYVFKIFPADERECEREKSCRWKGFVARCNQAEGIRQVFRNDAFNISGCRASGCSRSRIIRRPVPMANPGSLLPSSRTWFRKKRTSTRGVIQQPAVIWTNCMPLSIVPKA